jgi:arylsulfatase A-like enzyme/uncharacterized membrane protein
MAEEQTDVLVGAYRDVETAKNDFNQLVGQVKAKTVKIEGAILVTKDKDGTVKVEDTGDNLGRKGAGWGGGVGLAVGLFAPELLAPVVVGAAAGGLIGKFGEHRMKSGIQSKIGENLPAGTAGIIAVFDEEQRLGVEQALPGALGKSVVQSDKKGTGALKESLADAMGKFKQDRTALPIPDRNFGGVAGHTLKDSVADWSMVPGPKAPEGAPNVLLVLIDDAGFGGPETFGGPISTPNYTRVQKMGVTYNRFHVTAVCSPTRAATLTGRNHHRVGFGSVAEFPGPFPGYTAAKPKSCAALPRILSDNGYVTGGFGKWHLTPNNVQGAAGPFDHWPNAWGFNHFWGFLPGAAGQYDPIVVQDNSILGVPEGKDGKQYYFPDDMADKAIEWLHNVRSLDPAKPWFMYFSTGCSHSPHHVGKEWADKYEGRFDAGWDELRETTFERQKRLGVIPPDAELTGRPDAFPAWDSLDDSAKKLYARQMEVFSGYSENADHNVGRLLDAVEQMGDLDNTLVIYIWGDNGASLEGTTTGSFNEMTFLNGLVLDPEQQIQLIDKYGGLDALGSPHSAPHFSAAWAWANNTPFKWGKQTASFLGGTRDPMVIAWPERIKPGAEVRSQFTHCIDVAPTVLEAAGIPVPKTVDGIAQEPMDGTSFLYTFGDAAAAERHTQQYFEMLGSRGMYKDGWWAASMPQRLPWDLSPKALAKYGPDSDWDPDADVGWELYDLTKDFSQADNVAADNPDKVKELQDLWWREAERNRVLPLMGGLSPLYGILPPLPTQTRVTFAGDVQNVSWGLVPRIYGRSYAIEADLVVPAEGAEGVIVAFADFIGGFGLWVDGGGILHHTYSFVGVETYKQSAGKKLPSGDVKVRMLFETKEHKAGSGGHVTLFVNDENVGEGDMAHTVPLTFTSYSGLDIGRDNGLVVDLAYEDKAPYPFTGTVKEVVFDLKPASMEQEMALHQQAGHEMVAAGAAG